MKKLLAVFLLLAVIDSAWTLSEKDFNAPWDQLLKTHVTSDGLVDYQAIKQNSRQLDAYLQNVKALTIPEYNSWSRDRKLSFWINTYNALTIQAIVLNYPTGSIRKIKKVFTKKRMTILGKEMSLDDIEHGLIRPVFQEPRIHFALVCAAVSCPNLLNRAFSGALLEKQLESQTRYFAARKKYLILDKKNKTVYISSIIKWYGKDFVKKHDDKKLHIKKASDRASLNLLLEHRPIEWRQALEKEAYKVKYLKYDWSLNTQ